MTKVHLITGFLGSGKTTAILHLLQHRPAGQKWAVLVNEFGEIGIDGAILKDRGVAVREVPGGCMCCVSGLPFQMGLNMLLAREQPDVLLIEPTGLGHPAKILKMLQDENYREVLQLGATLCLLDPRQLLNPQYRDNDVFHDQIQVADVLVANKSDLCGAAEQSAFQHLLTALQPAKAASAWVQQGQIPEALLATESRVDRLANHPEAHAVASRDGFPILLPLRPNEALRRFENQGQGYFSLGWLLQSEPVFDANKLRSWLNGLDLERAKGIVATDEGWLVLNMRDGVLSEMTTRTLPESRLELIANQPLAADLLQRQLQDCLRR